jgi:acyl-CoA-binding protein
MRILKSQFEQAVADSKKLPERPGYKTLLRIYVLYKQATEGDITAKRPGLTDPVGRAKWDAWKAVETRRPTRRCSLIESLKQAPLAVPDGGTYSRDWQAR